MLRASSGEGIELMFEKGPASHPNLWMHQRYAEALLAGEIEHRASPARALFAIENDKGKGKKVYGRHTALLPMRQLADADLVCFKLKAISEVETLIEALCRR